MTASRTAWILSGLAAGIGGLVASHATATVLTVRESPVVAVAEGIIALTPGDLAEQAIQALGYWDKPVLVAGIVVVLLVAFGSAGLLARRHGWAGQLVFVTLAALGGVAALTRPGATGLQLVPVLVGLVTWLATFSWLTSALGPGAEEAAGGTDARGGSRRGFLLRLGAVGLGVGAVAVAGRWLGRGRRQVEQARELLRLDGVSEPVIPRHARIGLPGVTPWRTPNGDFYQVHTAIALPTIDPGDWSLRIHGMVDREVVLSYQDLLDRQLTEAWVTLSCVSNPVGGDLIGNAWWSGVRVAELLELAGVQEGADAVLQTAQDGWTCGTPLVALTDARDAMLAVAMNGEALPLEHGFPVRTIVPGLFGFVSACKWVVDLEVTRFDAFEAYWTGKGWAEQAPVKIASRIDVPSSGDAVSPGALRVGGVAWAQHTGIERVEIALDGGSWLPAEVAHVPTNDTWVQWAVTIAVDPGEHLLRVRATDKTGLVQTGVERDVIPDGATGWHTVDFTVDDA